MSVMFLASAIPRPESSLQIRCYLLGAGAKYRGENEARRLPTGASIPT
jgi:hypothetical protein